MYWALFQTLNKDHCWLVKLLFQKLLQKGQCIWSLIKPVENCNSLWELQYLFLNLNWKSPNNLECQDAFIPRASLLVHRKQHCADWAAYLRTAQNSHWWTRLCLILKEERILNSKEESSVFPMKNKLIFNCSSLFLLNNPFTFYIYINFNGTTQRIRYLVAWVG